MSGDNFPPNTSDRAAGPNWSGYMQRWAAGTSTIASFAFSGTGTQRRLYVPLATASAAGTISAADFTKLGAIYQAPPFCVATHSAAQSIPNGGAVFTALALNSESVDTNAFHDNATNNSRLTVPTGLAGKYLALGTLTWDTATNGVRYAALRVNGTAHFGAIQWRADGTAINDTQHAAYTLQLAVADYVELVVFQTSGAALNVLASGPTLEWIRLGD